MICLIVDGTEIEFISNDTLLTGNITLYAKWINKHIITLKDGNNSTAYTLYVKNGLYLLKSELPDYSTIAKDSTTASDNSYKSKYTCTGWDYNDSIITTNITINSLFTEVKYYKVTVTNTKSGSSNGIFGIASNYEYRISSVSGTFFDGSSNTCQASSTTIYVKEGTSIKVNIRKLISHDEWYGSGTEASFTVTASPVDGTTKSVTQSSTSAATSMSFTMPSNVVTIAA